MESSEGLLLDLQDKMAINFTGEVFKKHVPARKLHQTCEQLIQRWSKLEQDLNTLLKQVEDQVIYLAITVYIFNAILFGSSL